MAARGLRSACAAERERGGRPSQDRRALARRNESPTFVWAFPPPGHAVPCDQGVAASRGTATPAPQWGGNGGAVPASCGIRRPPRWNGGRGCCLIAGKFPSSFRREKSQIMRNRLSASRRRRRWTNLSRLNAKKRIYVPGRKVVYRHSLPPPSRGIKSKSPDRERMPVPVSHSLTRCPGKVEPPMVPRGADMVERQGLKGETYLE